MSERENQRVKLTKRLLKEALVRQLAEKSIDKITVTDLCREAELNRATFYHHYGSQYDVLEEMEQDLLADIQKMVENVDSESWSGALWRMEHIYEYLRKNKERSRMFFDNSSVGSNFSKKLYAMLQGQESIRSAMQAAQVDEDTMRLSFTFFEAGAFSLIRQWLLEDIPKSSTEIAVLISTLILRDNGGLDTMAPDLSST